MSDKDLQRVTESMSYIGHAPKGQLKTKPIVPFAAAQLISKLAKPVD